MKNPLKDIIGNLGSELKEKKILLCVTGSVAAIESPKIARLLMRHGAEVHVAMSDSAQKIIHANIMEWATGNPVITDLTGKIEHVQFAGSWCGKVDLILIAPSTSNTIGKIANGVDDTVVTTIVTTAIGTGIPIILVPAMHKSMFNHPAVKENIEKLESFKVEIVNPIIIEDKAKIKETEEIVEKVINKLSKKDMKNLRVLVTAGPTIEYIDPIRIITNKSSGKMGMALSREAYMRGAEVTLIYGPGKEEPPSYIRNVRVETAHEMFNAVVSNMESNDFHMVICVAAVSDYTPSETFDYKIPTHEVKALSLKLVSTPKIIEKVKQINPNVLLIAFKAECNIEKDELINRAYEKLKRVNADLIVANDVCIKGLGIGEDKNEVFLIDKNKHMIHIPPLLKNEVAKKIFDVILRINNQDK